MEYSYELRIPKSRVAVLIGKQGTVKKSIEESTKTKIKVDSKEGDVFVLGEDALGLYSAREIVRAVGRGFNPEIAQLLLKPDYVFEIIQLQDFCNKKEAMLRLKGRVIGKDGRARQLIEELTESYISVFGKTICILGLAENVAAARHAIESLLRGSPHSNVYRWLEKRRREMKRKRFIEL